MTDTVEIEVSTLAHLILGASHLYEPAFPDEERRQRIRGAAEEADSLFNKNSRHYTHD